MEAMDKLLEQSMLYDFYGELLTQHQRQIYEDAVFNDMSLTEIAEEQGISRQGVHDLLKRCNHILEDYENKLHLVSRFREAKVKVEEIHHLASQAALGGSERDSGEIMKEIVAISNELIEDL